MWEKLSNSSLLFSKSYYKNDSHFYNNTPFIHRLYEYYIHKGYYNIISSQMVNIFISNFIVIFLLFLINCVDFRGIMLVDSIQNIGDLIYIDTLFHLNYFEWILIIFFYIFTFMKIISMCDDIYTYNTIRQFYLNTLEIHDKELDYIDWGSIIDQVNIKTNQELNIFYINSIINSKHNYFISILDNNTIDLNNLNKLMEWNLYFCIFFTIYNNDFKINDNIFTEQVKYSDKMRFKMRFISIFNFIFMPFILTLLGFYYLFSYGEIFYNKPHFIVSRGYSNRKKWEFRYYNELEHEFRCRIKCAEKYSSEYTSLFKIKLLVILSRLIVFLLSSMFIVLVFMSIINDRILVNLMILPDKPVLWMIGILAPIIAVCRSFTIVNTQNKPNEVLEKLSDNIYLEQNDIQNGYRTWVYKKISKNFNYKAYLFIREILSIIITPFQLWNISYKSDNIMDYILKQTDTHNKILFLCSESNFENYNNMDIKDKDKKHLSFDRFSYNYPNWDNKIDQSVQINII
jgi:autophagy-related protein 9